MKVIKEYDEFQNHRETNDMEELIAIRFDLRAQEIELEAEIENMEPFGYWSTHTDLQNRYPKYRVINDIADASNKIYKLQNYLNFIKYGYE